MRHDNHAARSRALLLLRTREEEARERAHEALRANLMTAANVAEMAAAQTVCATEAQQLLESAASARLATSLGWPAGLTVSPEAVTRVAAASEGLKQALRTVREDAEASTEAEQRALLERRRLEKKQRRRARRERHVQDAANAVAAAVAAAVAGALCGRFGTPRPVPGASLRLGMAP